MCHCKNNSCTCCGGYCEAGKEHTCKKSSMDQKSGQSSQQQKCAGGMCKARTKKISIFADFV